MTWWMVARFAMHWATSGADEFAKQEGGSDKSAVATTAAHHKLVKRVVRTAATVLALNPAPSAVLGRLGAQRRGCVHGPRILGEVPNPSGTRSNGTKIVGVVPVVLWSSPLGMAGLASAQEPRGGRRGGYTCCMRSGVNGDPALLVGVLLSVRCTLIAKFEESDGSLEREQDEKCFER